MKTRSYFTPCLALAGTLFCSAAFAQDATPATAPMTSSETPGTATAKAATPAAKWTPKEKMFATKAAGGNLAEVKLGELAASKGTSEDVKSFGQQMVTDHGKANTDLEAVLTKKGMPFEPKMNAKQQATFDKMSAMSGAAFDKAYVADMLKDHVMDVAEYKEAIKETKDEDLKSYQTTTLPVLEHHLEMVKGMSKMSGSPAKKSS